MEAIAPGREIPAQFTRPESQKGPKLPNLDFDGLGLNRLRGHTPKLP